MIKSNPVAVKIMRNFYGGPKLGGPSLGISSNAADRKLSTNFKQSKMTLEEIKMNKSLLREIHQSNHERMHTD